jgi:hypothetical protein
MGLFKSNDERRIEREMRFKLGLRAIEKSIRDQDKFQGDFIKNAQKARAIGDQQQYLFIRNALKRTAAVKKMLQRQLVAMQNALVIQQQARASQQFAQTMSQMAQEIGRIFGELDLSQTQADWERAVAQAGSMEERMELFLDSMEQSASSGAPIGEKSELVSDEEIDRMIEADVIAAEKKQLSALDELESDLARELGAKRQKD